MRVVTGNYNNLQHVFAVVSAGWSVDDLLDDDTLAAAAAAAAWNDDGGAQEHIIGGRPAEKGRWPWVVSLVRWRPDEGVFRHTCGAALITPDWLLTAAHCVQ